MYHTRNQLNFILKNACYESSCHSSAIHYFTSGFQISLGGSYNCVEFLHMVGTTLAWFIKSVACEIIGASGQVSEFHRVHPFGQISVQTYQQTTLEPTMAWTS